MRAGLVTSPRVLMSAFEIWGWGSLPEAEKIQVVAKALDCSMRQLFPRKYAGLCHVYAIVGANVLSVCFPVEYRPVAGVAVIPTGSGFLEMLDDSAFHKRQGGAYHCWMESVGEKSKELVDLSFGNNAEYANICGVSWTKPRQDYLQGMSRRINLATRYHVPPAQIPDDKVWFKETENGRNWLALQMVKHEQEYARITGLVLRRIRLDVSETCP